VAALYGVMPGALATGELPPWGWLWQAALLTLAGVVGALLVLIERALRQRTWSSGGALRWLTMLLPFILLALRRVAGQPRRDPGRQQSRHAASVGGDGGDRQRSLCTCARRDRGGNNGCWRCCCWLG
jgi:hypothetical protein